MKDTHRNSWKLFVVSATRSGIKNINRITSLTVRHIGVRLFVLFFVCLFSTYALVDFITDKTHHTFLLHALSLNISLGGILAFLKEHFLHTFRTNPFPVQVGMVFIIATISFGLSKVAMRPLQLFKARRTFFTSNAEHELSTPLSIIKAAAEVMKLRRENLNEEQVWRFTESVIEEVDRMSEVIHYFLHYSSWNKRPWIGMSMVDLSEIANNATKKLAREARERGVTLELSRNGSAFVLGNSTALEEMIINLVKNSLRRSPRGGVVHISLEEHERDVMYIVSDEGKGVPQEDLPYIFDPFHKGKNGGHGLALTIAQEIAKMHFTDIRILNNSHTEMIFTVRLPK